ncbi:DUF192 domain-containing protein [Gracilibacillus xinjiangensis]|uniref:DUF192 domain-containing protein n=1 Tax=Gracilibacillus xinjiangensis TaxID=1193282 RepID=A0ABV8WV21_9BACI
MQCQPNRMRRCRTIQLINFHTDQVIAADVKKAYSFWRRFKGLMGTKSLPENSGLHIKPCTSIHTFNMKYSIDIIYLNKNDEIVGIEEELERGKIGKRFPNTTSVIELPAGTIKRTSLFIGNKVAFEGFND